jgi:ADP-heptose:LPS heptosyltransferase
MKEIKQLAIYMDHTNALLMELENNLIISRSITCVSEDKDDTDNQDHHFVPVNSTEEQQHESAYYKEIGDIIENYGQVVLFGPTDAKNELYNLLEDRHRFNDIKFELVNTDKMSNKQKHDFVTEYYK